MRYLDSLSQLPQVLLLATSFVVLMTFLWVYTVWIPDLQAEEEWLHKRRTGRYSTAADYSPKLRRLMRATGILIILSLVALVYSFVRPLL